MDDRHQTVALCWSCLHVKIKKNSHLFYFSASTRLQGILLTLGQMLIVCDVMPDVEMAQLGNP